MREKGHERDRRGVLTRSRERVLSAALSVASIAVLLVAAEIALRLAMAKGVSAVRDPSLYADGFSDDNFWKLQYRWRPEQDRWARGWVHPVLGWAPPVTPMNPLGTIGNSQDLTGVEKRPLLFYGDSFVQGVVGNERSIPAYLGRLLPEYAVLNYGVGGYGIDQMLLRIRLTARKFKNPIIVVGVLTVDLDRSLLTVRAGPKPYFLPSGERMALHGVPVGPAPERWFAEHPPTIRSYALAWLRRRIAVAIWAKEGVSPWRRRETKSINADLLEKIVHVASARRVPLLFVVFYTRRELRKVQWRECFLRDRFAGLRVPYVDTKVVLDPWGTDYLPEGHLNARGNERVAAAIADTVARQRGVVHDPAHGHDVRHQARSEPSSH